MQPYTTDDAAMNFLTEDESEERIRASYGSNHSRLAELKREWDPENLFSVNRLGVKPRGLSVDSRSNCEGQ